MQPLGFVAEGAFDVVSLAADLGASWEDGVLRRDGGAVHLAVRPDGDRTRVTLAATWAWPWRWPASSRLEGDVLRALAARGIRGVDATSEDVLRVAAERP